MRTVFGVAVSLVGSLKVMSPAYQRLARVVRTELPRRCTILLDRRSRGLERPLITSVRCTIRSWSSMAPSLRTDALLEELRRLTARHARPDETTAIDGVLLSTAGRPGEPQASTTGTVMALIAQGAKRLAIGDRVYDYGPGQYLVASVDLPITGHYTHAARRRAGPGLRPDPAPAAHRRPAPGDGGPRAAARARMPRRPGSASPRPRPSCSTRSCAWSACSTAQATETCSRR